MFHDNMNHPALFTSYLIVSVIGPSDGVDLLLLFLPWLLFVLLPVNKPTCNLPGVFLCVDDKLVCQSLLSETHLKVVSHLRTQAHILVHLTLKLSSLDQCDHN